MDHKKVWLLAKWYARSSGFRRFFLGFYLMHRWRKHERKYHDKEVGKVRDVHSVQWSRKEWSVEWAKAKTISERNGTEERQVPSCYISTFCGGRKLREQWKPRKAKITRSSRSERFVGRGEVERIRAAPLEESSKRDDSKKRWQGNNYGSPKERQKKAREYRILESVEKERRSRLVTVLDRRKRDSEKDEAGKRRVLLLLNVEEIFEVGPDSSRSSMGLIICLRLEWKLP